MVETNFLKLFSEQSCQHEPKVPRNDSLKTLIFLPLALFLLILKAFYTGKN